MKVISQMLPKIGCHGNVPWDIKQEGLAVASIAQDVGSSSTNRSSDMMHFLPNDVNIVDKQNCHVFPVQTHSK